MKKIFFLIISVIIVFIFVLFISPDVEAITITAPISEGNSGEIVDVKFILSELPRFLDGYLTYNKDYLEFISMSSTHGSISGSKIEIKGEGNVSVTPVITAKFKIKTNEYYLVNVKLDYVDLVIDSNGNDSLPFAISPVHILDNPERKKLEEENSNQETSPISVDSDKPTISENENINSSSISSTNKNSSSNSNKNVAIKSNDNFINSLTIDKYMLIPEFQKDISEYSLNIDYEIEQLEIDAILSDSKSTIQIIGNENLQVGENEILLNVTSEDGTIRTYKINVIKEALIPPLLKSIVLKNINNKDATTFMLTPTFTPDVYKYTITVSNSISSLLVDAIASDDKLTVEILGGKDLIDGENEIVISVKNSQGFSSEYNITVIKESPSYIYLYIIIFSVLILIIIGIGIFHYSKKKKWYI